MPDYPKDVARLLAEPHSVSLGPGTPNEALRAKLKATSAAILPPCAAGLWLRFDFLDESHSICQTAEGVPDYDFWHAIMHRREPDAFNSKYWWRRVGAHPVLEQLRERAPEVGYAYTTPEEFVDFCEKVRDTGSTDEELANRVQQLEWQLLFDHCLRSDLRCTLRGQE